MNYFAFDFYRATNNRPIKGAFVQDIRLGFESGNGDNTTTIQMVDCNEHHIGVMAVLDEGDTLLMRDTFEEIVNESSEDHLKRVLDSMPSQEARDLLVSLLSDY